MNIAVIYVYTSSYRHTYVRLKPLDAQVQNRKRRLSQVENHSLPKTKTVIKRYGRMHPQGE